MGCCMQAANGGMYQQGGSAFKGTGPGPGLFDKDAGHGSLGEKVEKVAGGEPTSSGGGGVL